MTANEFRKLALAIPCAVEASHMNHPDFRIGGKIFATLGPGETWGMVKLTPEQQKSLIQRAPSVFEPCSGAWGERGATTVHLESAEKAVVQEALDTASRNVSAKVKKKRT
jgi:hypothetical protein